MHQVLNELCDGLDRLAKTVVSASVEERTMREAFGWNFAALTRHDLGQIASGLAQKVRDSGPDELEAPLAAIIADFSRRLLLLPADTVPHMFNGNGVQAIPAYIETLNGLSAQIDQIIGWVPNPEAKLMPIALASRLRRYNKILDSLAPDSDLLNAQISKIKEATEAAENLPIDLNDLADAKKKVDKFATDAAELSGKLDERAKDVTALVAAISAQQIEAEKLVQKCEEAYRITTTKGLAASFDQRAINIEKSLRLWVLGLLLALASAAYIGDLRVKLLTAALEGTNPQMGVIWIQIVLSLLSLGAPLWFAWVATKQLSQRFRLAEDYGFKASVAKAYEGYRKEAARLDPILEARLFSSALSRLEEAPLRLIDAEVHGSPWHELIASDAFQRAIQAVPELGEKLVELAQKGVIAITAKPK